MTELKTLPKLVSLLIISLIVKIRSESEICGITNGNPLIVEAFRYSDNVIFVINSTTSPGVQEMYYLGGFKYNRTNPKLSFASAVKHSIGLLAGEQAMYTFNVYFTLRFPYSRANPIRVIGLKYKTVDIEEPQYTGYVIWLEGKNLMARPSEFNLNLYKIVPNSEPLNLVTLFQKFPQDDMLFRIHSILTFPLKDRFDDRQRLFVYYLEKPPKGSNSSGTAFKRHIIVGEEVDYEGEKEIDWHHDIPSGSCLDQLNIVNASFSLSEEYTPTPGHSEFDIIEFSDQRYFIKRVTLSGSTAAGYVVSPNLTELSTGYVYDLFGCTPVVPTTTTTTTTTTPNTTTSLAPNLPIDGQSPTVDGQSPTVDGQSPTADGQSPTADGQSPTVDGQSPTVDGPIGATVPSSGSSFVWILLMILFIILVIAGVVFLVYYLFVSKADNPAENRGEEQIQTSTDTTTRAPLATPEPSPASSKTSSPVTSMTSTRSEMKYIDESDSSSATSTPKVKDKTSSH